MGKSGEMLDMHVNRAENWLQLALTQSHRRPHVAIQ